MEFGKRLRELRRGRGLTMQELAKEIGVSKQAILRWEKGIYRPSPKNLKKLNEFFGQSLEKTDVFDIATTLASHQVAMALNDLLKNMLKKAIQEAKGEKDSTEEQS